mgnify:FL=1
MVQRIASATACKVIYKSSCRLADEAISTIERLIESICPRRTVM